MRTIFFLILYSIAFNLFGQEPIEVNIDYSFEDKTITIKITNKSNEKFNINNQYITEHANVSYIVYDDNNKGIFRGDNSFYFNDSIKLFTINPLSTTTIQHNISNHTIGSYKGVNILITFIYFNETNSIKKYVINKKFE